MPNRFQFQHKPQPTTARSLADYAEHERRRLARELHDDIGQRLALLADDADSLRRELHCEDEANRRRLENLVKQARVLADDLRKISHTLHPAILEDLGLTVALRSLASHMAERSGLGISFSAGGAPNDLPSEISTAVYRIAQEALRNFTKHAGGDATARVTLEAHQGELVLTVSDTGNGFDPGQKSGLGLISMRERAYLVGGVLTVDSAAGRGATITFRLPLTRQRAN